MSETAPVGSHGRTWVLGACLAAACHCAGAASLPAANDRSGTFEHGAFKLPPLADPDEYYILKIAVPGAKERTIALPAGAIGLVLGDNAVPAGAWSWSFRVQGKVNATVPLLTPDRLAVSAWDLHHLDDTWLLEWRKVPQASAYRVALASDEETDPAKAPRWGKETRTECDAACLAEMEGTVAFQRIAVKPGKRYRWTVAALDKDGIVIGQSEARVLEVAPSAVAAFRKAGWRLQRSDTISTRDAAKPALFSYAANEADTSPRTTAYSAQAALLWQGSSGIGGIAFPTFSAEARRTSSGDAKTSDVTRVRLGVYGATRYATWSAAAKYETVRKDSTDKGMLELGITPVFGVLDQWINPGPAPSRDSSGVIVPATWPILQIKPLVSFGADLGKTFSRGASQETGDTVRRLRSDLRLDMLWGRTARVLGVVSVSTYMERTYWRLLGQGRSYHLDQAGASIGLTPEISLELAYSAGQDAPTFQFARSTNIGFGVKF